MMTASAYACIALLEWHMGKAEGLDDEQIKERISKATSHLIPERMASVPSIRVDLHGIADDPSDELPQRTLRDSIRRFVVYHLMLVLIAIRDRRARRDEFPDKEMAGTYSLPPSLVAMQNPEDIKMTSAE